MSHRMGGPDELALTVARYESRVAVAGAQLIASRRSPRTRSAYTADLLAWLAFCAERGFDPDEALLPHAVLYRDSLEGANAPRTVTRRLASLSMIYGALQANGVVARNPFDGRLLPRPEISNVGTTPLPARGAIDAVIAACAADTTWKGKRDLALVRLMYDTGMRRESAAHLIRADLQLAARTAWVTVKGGRKEPVTLPDATHAALTEWLEYAHPCSRYVFPSGVARAGADKPIALTQVNRIMTERSAEAGVPTVTPHSLRAEFITEAFDLGLPAHEIQSAVHHRSAETTRRYDRHRRGASIADAVAEKRRDQHKRPKGG